MYGIDTNFLSDYMPSFAIALIAVSLYFIPSFVANYRKHSKAAAIRILNLLLGWTILGWVVAIVWAFAEDNRRTVEE